MRLASALIIGTLLTGCAMTSPAPSAPATGLGNMIMVRQTSKTPDQAVDAIKSYAEANKWAYLGANRVKQGEVTLVKVCIPAVGAIMWSLGLQTSALLPCGNLAVYQKGGGTEVSMLDPGYMAVLVPHPEVSRASTMATTLLTQMLDSVTR